jgi:hypothetical protein
MAITYQALATNTLASTTSTVTFTGFSTGYTDLRLVADCLTNGSGSDYYRINGVTTGSYAGIIQVNGAAVQQWTGNTAQEFFSGSSATLRQQYVLDIFDYNATGRFKGILFMNMGNGRTTVGNEAASSTELGFGYMNANTNAVTSVSFHKFSGVFAVGSIFTLYGIAKA